MLSESRCPTHVKPSVVKPWTGALAAGGSNWWERLAEATARAVEQSLATTVIPEAR
jgi:hypothetical protein